MKKQIIITMDQLSGSIDYELAGDTPPAVAEVLGMIEFTKYLIYKELDED